MSTHTELGQACTAAYTLHRRTRGAHELGIHVDELSYPLILDISNYNGDGLALEGTRAQLLQFADQLKAFILRETSPLPALTHALADLHALQRHRNQELDAGHDVSRIDENEVRLLHDIADIAAKIADQL